MRTLRTCALLLLVAGLGLANLPARAAPSFRIASFNLENYRLHPVGTRPAKSPTGRDLIRTCLLTMQADVVALQEIGGREALLELRDALARDGLNYPHWAHITAFDTNIQVALLSRFPITALRPHTNDTYLLLGRRFRVSRGFLETDLEAAPGYRFTLVTAHLKSRRRVAFADEAEMREQEALLLRALIHRRLQNAPQSNLMVLGDFNDTPNAPAVRHLIGKGRLALVDTRPAERNGDSDPHPNPRYAPRRITWTHHYGLEDAYSRFDYILLSPGMAREWLPEETFILTLPNWGTASDHRPIVATFTAADR